MIEKDITESLRMLCRGLSNHDTRWVLVGSTSLALQEVDVTPGDIDILTDEAAIYEMNGNWKFFMIGTNSLDSWQGRE